MGGPLVAADSPEALADVRADAQFRTLFQTWKKLDTLQQGVIAVAALVVATGGFLVGGGLGESLAQQREGYSATETASTATPTSNEVSEFFAGDGI